MAAPLLTCGVLKLRMHPDMYLFQIGFLRWGLFNVYTGIEQIQSQM